MRPKTSKILTTRSIGNFFLAVALISFAQASPIDFDSIGSPELQVLENSQSDGARTARYPFWAKLIEIESLKYIPEAVFDGTLSRCLDYDYLAGQFAKADPYSSILADCETKFQRARLPLVSSFASFYRTMMLRLDVDHYPSGKHVVLHLPDGVQTKGFLVLQNSKVHRPLVILRLGIFSNSTEFLPERFLLLQFFEQMNFNVLVLESSTSQEAIGRNASFSLAGVEEGIQNYQIAKLLTDKKQNISKMFSEVILAGISMGGQGVFLGSRLSDLNPVGGKKVIARSMAFCPLIDLRRSMDWHVQSHLAEWSLNEWSRFRWNGLEKRYPQLNGERPLAALFESLEHKNWAQRIQKAHLNFPKEMKETAALDFWKLHDFLPIVPKIQTPLLVVSTIQDPIVPFDLNTGKILTTATQARFMLLNQGVHCSLPGAYQWLSLSPLWQNFLEPTKVALDEMVFELDQEKFAFEEDWSVVWNMQNAPGSKQESVRLTFSQPRFLWLPQLFPKKQSWSIPLTKLALPPQVSSKALLQRLNFLWRPQIKDGKLLLRAPQAVRPMKETQ